MTWPSDDLIGDELDQSTDNPTNARTQLNSLLLKVQAMLAAINAGSTPWDSTSDGAGSGLDADLLDGSHLAAVLARANHTGTQLMSTISDSGALALLSAINNGNWSGTDLAVNNGGSGRGSSTAYGTIIGGTTSAGAHQSVAPGTFGQVLTSAGVAAAPTFQDGVSGSDFYSADVNLGAWPTGDPTPQNFDPGFGTDDFQWGFTSVDRTYKTYTIWGENNIGGGNILYEGDGPVPTFVNSGATGRIKVHVTGTPVFGPGFTIKMWARRNV